MGAEQNNELIEGAVGKIEVRVDIPGDDLGNRPIAVVCHPHPQHGGTMDNKVVYCLARELAALGLVVARFNFRGVGASEGQYGEGAGECDDLLAVVAVMKQRFPDRAVWLAGFSFGGYIAARMSDQCAAQHLLLVAPAVTRDYFTVEASVSVPGLLIHGSQDQLIDSTAAREWALEQSGGVEFQSLEGADHFFHGQLNGLRSLVRDKAEQWLGSVGG
ncbi:MAG: alpha/beta fold hydrolase [Gammaproteobacteria bacterium]